jgi:hypothetical protein
MIFKFATQDYDYGVNMKQMKINKTIEIFKTMKRLVVVIDENIIKNL